MSTNMSSWRRNQDHFAPPKPQRWIMNVLPNAEATLGQISTGEINLLWEWTGDSEILSQVAEADPNIALFSSPTLGMSYFAINVRQAPLDDVALRRALAHVRAPRSPSSTTSSRVLPCPPIPTFRRRLHSGTIRNCRSTTSASTRLVRYCPMPVIAGTMTGACNIRPSNRAQVRNSQVRTGGDWGKIDLISLTTSE